MHVPRDLPFTRKVEEAENFIEFPFDSCPRDKLVGVESVLTDALKIIIRNAPRQVSTESGRSRVPPLIYSSLSRGGKSTFLMLLFDRLKSGNFATGSSPSAGSDSVHIQMAPIIISFNGGFRRRSGESDLDALLRVIASKLVSLEDSSDACQSIVCDKRELLRHIELTSKVMPVVLLIDELNMLSRPLDEEASIFLKEEFLDKANRYLVYTTHVLFGLDEVKLGDSLTSSSIYIRISSRGYKTVHQPISYDIKALRSMSDDCRALTSMEAALYGYIPSLIFSVKAGDVELIDLFKVKWRAINMLNEYNCLQQFIQAVLNGNSNSPTVREFYMFGYVSEQSKVRWPLCYIDLILSSCVENLNIEWIKSLISGVNELVESLKTFAKKESSGFDWEVIVTVGIVLQCLHASLNGSYGPFSIAVHCKPFGSVVQLRTMPGEMKTLEEAKKFIDTELAQCKESTFLILTPAYASFPYFDGFVCYKAGGVDRRIAFQLKAGGKAPDKGKAPVIASWLDKAVLIRGKAPGKVNASIVPLKWHYLNGKEVKELLGYSLTSLIQISRKT